MATNHQQLRPLLLMEAARPSHIRHHRTSSTTVVHHHHNNNNYNYKDTLQASMHLRRIPSRTADPRLSHIPHNKASHHRVLHDRCPRKWFSIRLDMRHRKETNHSLCKMNNTSIGSGSQPLMGNARAASTRMHFNKRYVLEAITLAAIRMERIRLLIVSDISFFSLPSF